MRRCIPLALALVLGMTGCGDDTTVTTHGSTTTTTTTVTDTAATTPTGADPSTTSATATTSSPVTTTTPESPLLPAARPRNEIPWGDVDRSWVMALFSTEAGYPDVEPAGEEIVVAYLVGPDGSAFEVARWPSPVAPHAISDVRPDGRRALLVNGPETELLDLATGVIEPTGISAPHMLARFTRPTGRDYVVLTYDGDVEMFAADGSPMGVLGSYVEEEDFHFGPHPPWVFAPTGLSLVINGESGPIHVDNRGNPLGELLVGGQELCYALAWWSDADVLMRCVNTLGDRSDLVLWLVDSGGRYPNYPLTEIPDDAEGLEGFLTALQAGDDIFYQGFVAAGSGWYPIYRVEPGVGMVPLGDEVAGELIAAGPDSMTLHRTGCCGEVYGGLVITDHDGTEIARMDAPGGYRGVIAAVGVGAP